MKNDLCWSVYVHTNKVNGKRYVGITSSNPKRRWSNGVKYKGCRYFNFAIEKYGWDGFEHKVIISGISKSFAEAVERGMIAYYRITDASFGYNIQPGGISNGGLSEEGLLSIRECNTGLNAKNRKPVVVFDLSGRKVAEFGYIRGAAEYLGVTDLHHHIYSRHGTVRGHIVRLKSDVGNAEQLSEEDVADARSVKYKNGRISSRARPVTVFDAATGEKLGDFPTIRMAKNHFHTDFSSALYNDYGSMKGFVVRYSDQCVGKTRLTQEEIDTIARDYGRKEVFQFSKDRTFIRSYPSLREASNETGTSYKTLSLCLSGKCLSAGGFLWSFSLDDVPSPPKTTWESRKENGTTCGIPVDQIDLKTGKVIATFQSIGQAAKAANTYKTSISEIINHIGNHVSAGGFGWKYHDEGRD